MSGKKEIKLTTAGFLEIETELAKLREEDRPSVLKKTRKPEAK